MTIHKRLAVLLFLSVTALGCSDVGDDDVGNDPSESTQPAVEEKPEPAVLSVPLDQDYTATDVTLRWAAWGEQGDWVDATDYIRAELAKSGAFTCRGAPLVREIGDPGARYANALILLLDTPGGPLKIGMNNTSWIRINLQGHELNPPGDPLSHSEIKRMNEYVGGSNRSENQIVWARWGRSKFGDHWVDAYPVTQALIAKNGRVQNAPRGLPLQHPVKDRDKFLQVLLSMGGQVMKLQMWGAWFELAPDEKAQVSPAASTVES